MTLKKYGFTLAEVLMTLAIIGVIAALTIPVVRNYGSEKQYYAGYKKALTVGTDALEYAIGSGRYKDISSRNEDTNGPVAQSNFKEFSAYFAKTKECFSSNNTGCWASDGEKLDSSKPGAEELAFIDASGFAWSLYSNKENIILVDINSFQKPNQYGKDRWYFVPVTQNGVREGISAKNGRAVTLAPYNPLNDKEVANLSDIVDYNEKWCQHPPCNIKSGLLTN